MNSSCNQCCCTEQQVIRKIKFQFDQQIKKIELGYDQKITELNLRLHSTSIAINKRIDDLVARNVLQQEPSKFILNKINVEELDVQHIQDDPIGLDIIHDESDNFDTKNSELCLQIKFDKDKTPQQRKSQNKNTTANKSSKRKIRKYSEVFKKLEFCPICNENFEKYTRFGIKKHIKLHKGSLKNACNLCPKQFLTKGELTKHLRVHSGEKPFICEMCSKNFAQENNLRKHQQRSHTNIKQYTCELCSKQFIDKYDLLSHMRTHSQEKLFKCKICETSFNHAASLRSHDLQHKGIKKFKCDLCSRVFTAVTTLKHHMQSHTGERPHECRICSKKYSKKCHLKKHITSFHKIGDPTAVKELLQHKN